MKILHIISRFDIGGAEQVAVNISKSGNRDIEYHIVEVARGSSQYSLKMIDDLKAANITIHRSSVKSTKFAIVLFPLRLIALIKKIKPDVIHTHTETPDLALFLSFNLYSPMFRNIGIVRTIHNTQLWNNWGRIGNRVEKFLKRRSHIVSISSATNEAYRNRYGFDSPLIYNGVAEVAQCMFPTLIPNKLNILFCGRMEYQKGCATMKEVIAHFGNNSKFHFHIAGSGSMISEVKMALSRFDNVSFYDSISELPKYLGSFDYLFMPSQFEGLALTPMEAAMAHTPTIINDAPGLGEIFPEDWKIKVFNNDIDAYINIFNSLGQKSDLGDKIYQHVKSRYSVETMRESYEKLYYEIQR